MPRKLSDIKVVALLILDCTSGYNKRKTLAYIFKKDFSIFQVSNIRSKGNYMYMLSLLLIGSSLCTMYSGHYFVYSASKL